MKKSKAFTLIELLVVVAIIGIIATIAVVATRGVIGRARITRTLQSEASMHRYLGMDIVGWWKFDGDLEDISGYNNHGRWKGTDDPVPSEKWVTGVPGKRGKALAFNGTDYVNITHFDTLVNNEMSYSFWMKRDLFTQRGGMLSKYVTTTGLRSWAVRQANVSSDVGQIELITSSDGSNSNVAQSGTGFIEDNVWIHVTVTYDKGAVLFYKNGVYHSENTTYTSLFNNVAQPLTLGKYNVNTFYNGKMDDVRIYAEVLTSEEINTLYTETKHKYIAENNNEEK